MTAQDLQKRIEGVIARIAKPVSSEDHDLRWTAIAVFVFGLVLGG